MWCLLACAVALLAAGLGTVQLASDAIFARAGAAASLPAHLRRAFGVRVYSAIERFAPAPYVEGMLARAAFDDGDLAAAQTHALRLPVGAVRAEYLARIAAARGNDRLAQHDYLLAGDFFAIQDEVANLARRDPKAAYALELKLKNRLEHLTTHPDAVAEAYWHLGQLATLIGYVNPPERTAWWRTGMRQYRRAAALAPLSEKYLLAAGSQALALGDLQTARRNYTRAINVNPASADALAGLGLVALRQGDRQSAQRFASRARALNSGAHLLQTLDRALR